MGYYEYSDDETLSQLEVKNTLLLVDNLIEKLQLNAKPVFHIIGGAGLLLQGLTTSATQDIDTVLRLEAEVRDTIEDFLNDGAAEVAILPVSYTSRLIPCMEGELEHCTAYIASPEDILISKLGAGRSKDFEDIKHCHLAAKCKKSVTQKLIKELSHEHAELVRVNWKTYLRIYGGT